MTFSDEELRIVASGESPTDSKYGELLAALAAQCLAYKRDAEEARDRVLKWFSAEKATKSDVPGYYFFAFNPKWSAPRIRVGYYDALDNQHRFRLVGGQYMDLEPSYVANLPNDPFSLSSSAGEPT